MFKYYYNNNIIIITLLDYCIIGSSQWPILCWRNDLNNNNNNNNNNNIMNNNNSNNTLTALKTPDKLNELICHQVSQWQVEIRNCCI